MSASVKVLSEWRSMFGLRVLMALKEKGLEYEYEEQDLLNKSKLLLECNPVHKKVPVLIHNGKPICESLVILQYIDEVWPSQDDKGLLPKDAHKRALVRFWADYVDKKLFEAWGLVLSNTEGELVERGRSIVKESMVTLDGALHDVFGGGPYFGGEHINMVDLTLGSYICWFEAMETVGNFKFLDESTCPHLCAWTKAVVQHPSVKEGLATAQRCMIRRMDHEEARAQKSEQVKVLFFARAREIAGVSETTLRLQETKTIKECVDLLTQKFPGLQEISSCMLVALNEEYVDASSVVKHGDELA